jgi:hypothetical protein
MFSSNLDHRSENGGRGVANNGWCLGGESDGGAIAGTPPEILDLEM